MNLEEQGQINAEEQDPVWALLGARRTPAVSPFFSRNILREIRVSRSPRGGVSGWLRRNLRLVALSGCSLALFAVAGGSFLKESRESQAPLAAAQQFAKNNDYDTISHLDELLAYEENSIWLENSE